MLGVHASASAIIQYGKIARKQVSSHLESLFVLMEIWFTTLLFFSTLLYIILHYPLRHSTVVFILTREFFSLMFAKRVLLPVSCKCGAGHPDSYPYNPHRAHRGLLPEDQTAGQMLLTAGWCHGQERVYAGKSYAQDFVFVEDTSYDQSVISTTLKVVPLVQTQKSS